MRLKILIILTTLIVSQNLYAAEKKDCSSMKKLSKMYLKCKARNMKVSTQNLTNVTMDTRNIKEKKYISDWFKKKK